MVRLSVVMHAPTCQARGIEGTLRTLMRGTRLEPGCLECQLWTNAEEENPGRTDVHYEERWASERAIENRVRSEAFTKVLEVLEASVETPHVEFDFVSRQQGLEYVEEVRRADEG
jgi:quinol monooxygenase YgiN